MESLDLWRLCEELNIVQAALLLCEINPDSEWEYIERWEIQNRPPGYEASKMAITSAVRSKKVEGTISYFSSSGQEVNFEESLVAVDSLKQWLENKGFSEGFFFPKSTTIPDYLNKKHSCYSPKLAGAIRGWEAIQEDPKYQDNGKTIKANLGAWLVAHAADYDLVNEKGDVMNSTIGELAKIANWSTGGGAPRTPERNLPAESENPPPTLKATDDEEFEIDIDEPPF